MSIDRMENVAIIGFGKLGSHLYYALKETGKYSIPVVLRSPRSKPEARTLGNCNIIFIAVKDSNIGEAAKGISRLPVNLSKKYVFHTSGALSSALLLPLKKKGAATGSFHPVQTFETAARSRHKRFNDIYIAVEGDDKAVKKGCMIAKHLGSNPFLIKSGDKVLHHINCVIASNYLVTHFHGIDLVSRKISRLYRAQRILINGFKKHKFFYIYKPLIKQTLENISTKGIGASLSGPIQRNDVRIINLHLKALKKELPDLLNFYSRLGIDTIRLAVNNGELSKRAGNKLIKLFKNSITENAVF